MNQNEKIYNVGSPYNLAEKILDFFRSLNIKNGFFIEAGASNGFWQSNSYYLEKILGWNGILIEPNKHMFELCKRSRENQNNYFYNCALVSSDYSEDFIKGYFNEKEDFGNIMMAQVEGIEQSEEREQRWIGKQSIFVPAKTLDSIIKEVDQKIDFLSLDVEGYELEVLDGSKIEKHRPKYVCVEVWSSPKNHQEKVIEYFSQRGYEINQFLSERDILFQDKQREEK